MTRFARLSFAATLALLALSCAHKEEASRGAAAEPPRLAPAHGAVPAGSLRFTPPEGWIAQTPSSSMRKAQYSLPRAAGDAEDAELVVFYFGGQGGSVSANIDRWIGQFQRADGSPARDDAQVSRRTSHSIPLTVVDVRGTYTGGGGPMTPGPPKPGFRMLAAVAEAPDGPWFFKLTGPASTAAKWESSFQSFLDTIQ